MSPSKISKPSKTVRLRTHMGAMADVPEVPVTQFRKRPDELLDRAEAVGIVALARRGKVCAVLISMEVHTDLLQRIKAIRRKPRVKADHRPAAKRRTKHREVAGTALGSIQTKNRGAREKSR